MHLGGVARAWGTLILRRCEYTLLPGALNAETGMMPAGRVGDVDAGTDDAFDVASCIYALRNPLSRAPPAKPELMKAMPEEWDHSSGRHLRRVCAQPLLCCLYSRTSTEHWVFMVMRLVVNCC
jgi:hypothetical protein